MATTTGRGSSVKRQDVEAGDEAQHVVRDQVEELARAGARKMLLAALEDEVNVYLQRDRYQRRAAPDGGGSVFRGYRNGTTPRRLAARLWQEAKAESWARPARPACPVTGSGCTRGRPGTAGYR